MIHSIYVNARANFSKKAWTKWEGFGGIDQQYIKKQYHKSGFHFPHGFLICKLINIIPYCISNCAGIIHTGKIHQ